MKAKGLAQRAALFALLTCSLSHSLSAQTVVFDDPPMPGVVRAGGSLRSIVCTEIKGDEVKALKIARMMAIGELARAKGVKVVDGRETLKNGELTTKMAVDVVEIVRAPRELRSGTVMRLDKREACSEVEGG